MKTGLSPDSSTRRTAVSSLVGTVMVTRQLGSRSFRWMRMVMFPCRSPVSFSPYSPGEPGFLLVLLRELVVQEVDVVDVAGHLLLLFGPAVRLAFCGAAVWRG